MPRLRLLLLLALLPLAAQAQAPCANGRASHQGTTYACENVDLLARIPLADMGAQAGNDSWGWTDPETGREYALMGLDNGTFFVDVTEPAAPLLLGKLPSHTGSSVWRDIKVYADHAFVVADLNGAHGMQVFDLTRLRGLGADRARIFSADAHYDGVTSSHNLHINEDTGFGYIVGAALNSREPCGRGLHIVDLRQPLAPAFAGCFAEDGYTHDAQCIVYDGPDARYAGREVCFASNEDTVTIVDVTDRDAPRMLSQAIYPNAAYTHQGWLTEDRRFFLVNDELDEMQFGFSTRTLIFDVSDLERPEYVGAYDHGTRSIDHNLFIRGRHAYAANYTTGLRVLDLDLLARDGPSGIATVAWFDTHPEHDDPVFRGAWSNYPFFESGTVVVSDINRGLFLLRVTAFGLDGEPAPPGGAPLSLAAFPNPTDGATTVQVTLGAPSDVRVAVFDLLGRRVALLHEGPLPAGETPLALDARGLGAGAYVVQAEGGGATASVRLVLTR